MKKFSELKVATKLSLGFGVVLVLMMISGGLAYFALSSVTSRMDDVINDKVPKLEGLADVNYHVIDIARSLRNGLLEIDAPDKMEGHIQRVLESRGKIKAILEKIEPRIIHPEGKASMARILAARAEFIDGQETVIRLLRQKKPVEAREFLLTEMRKRQGVYAEATGKLQVFQRKLMAETSVVAESEATRATAAILGALLVSIVLSVLIAGLIIRDLMRQLGGEPGYAAGHVLHIAAGDLGQQIAVRGGDQGSLLLSLQHMQASLATLVTEIQRMVAAAAQGDFSSRIDLAGKQGFGRQIGESLNTLAETTQTGLQDVMRVSQALAAGDLSQKIDKQYPGVFGQTGSAVNATVDSLKGIVFDLDLLVDNANQGDFSTRIDLAGKQGFPRTLSEQLNLLAATTESGLLDVMRVANALAQGDLTQQIEKDYPGLFGETGRGINTTVDNLTTLISQIQVAVNSITTAAGEIAAGNQDLSARTEEQASSLEETASSMEELTSTIQGNTQSANNASRQSQVAATLAERGGETVRNSVKLMADIAASSNRIADIIGVIDGIAFQTNILALNAAVEAARAGEQGRGFAVVATEVRSLAKRSADAAKEIKGLIDESAARVEAGNAQASQAGQQMNEIVQSIEQVSTLINDIAGASREQAEGIEQISLAVSQMDEVTQQNAALVEQAAAAAESLEEQAQDLSRAVAAFKTRDAAKPRSLPAPRVAAKAALPAPSARSRSLPQALGEERDAF